MTDFSQYQNFQCFQIQQRKRPFTTKPPLNRERIVLTRDGNNFKDVQKDKLFPPIEQIQQSNNSIQPSRTQSIERNKENLIGMANRVATPRYTEQNSSQTNKKRSASNSISFQKEILNAQASVQNTISIQNGNSNSKNSSSQNSSSSLKDKESNLIKKTNNIQIQKLNIALRTDSSSGSLFNQLEDITNRPKMLNVNPNINKKNNNLNSKEQKPISAQFSKKPRVLSIKRSQNPDLQLLEEAHPFIETTSCFPILKKQITAFPPQVTAKSCALFDGSSGKFIDGKCVHNQREVASLTKIMTCYVVLEFFENVIQKDMRKVFVKVSNRASQTSGTSARLIHNMIISIWDLLFGLMLPSGNDSAICLAENVGSLMHFYYVKEDYSILNDELIYNEQLLQQKLNEESTPNTGMSRFLIQMNQHAVNFQLINTNYNNPHGLKNILNKSSAYDVAKISSNAMKLESFKQIVNTKSHVAQVKIKNKSGQYENAKWQWENTNKLLDKGWAGIKTGITDTAGPCLASCIKFRDPVNNVNRFLIIVILNTQSMDIRWSECQKIAAWAVENYNPEL